MPDLYSCAHRGCTAAPMTATELASHAVGTHSGSDSEVELVDDVATKPPKLFGRKPRG
jgi:hypothetical protein